MSSSIGPYQIDFTNMIFFADIANPNSYSSTAPTVINNLSPILGYRQGVVSGTVTPSYSANNSGYLTLDGSTNQWLNMSTGNSWASFGGWTASIWFRLLSPPAVNDTIVMLGQFTSTVEFVIDCQETYFRAGSKNSTLTQMVNSTTTVSSRIGLWTNIVATRDTNNLLSIYVNGELDGIALHTPGSFAISGSYSIGYNNNGGYTHMDFGMHRYYNVAIDASTVKAQFNAHRSRYGV